MHKEVAKQGKTEKTKKRPIAQQLAPVAALGTQSQGQQAILTHQIQAASTMVDRLQEVAGSLENVEKVSAMETARLNIQVSKAETLLEYWRQDLLSAEENQQVFQEGGGMSWNDDSAGLIGAGWRYAAPPTVEMVRLCLPVADAQRRANARVELLSVIVEEARYRLGLMEPLEASRKVHPWEVKQARLGLAQIEGLLAAEKGRLQVSELLYQRLLRASRLDTFSPDSPPAPDYARTASAAVQALETLPQDGAWLYGLVRVTGNELLAVARCRAADDMVQCRLRAREAYGKVASVREVELKRADYALRRAEASARIAAQDYEVCHLASRQWLDLARAHRAASYLPDPWLNADLLSGGKEIIAARLEVEKQVLASAEAGSRFQEERLAGLQGLTAGAASVYEMEMARLKLMQREGEVASSLHRMTVMHHARDLVDSSALDLQGNGVLGNVLDLSSQTRGMLAQLAGELQGPNAGTLLQMRAAREMTEMRSRKLDDLLTRGFASKRETADLRTQLTCLTSLLAAEEARGQVADSAREVIAGLFSEEVPKKPGEDVMTLPELR